MAPLEVGHQQHRVEWPLQRLAARWPTTVSRAKAAIDVALSRVAGSVWPEAAWRFSYLTDDGFPLEFAWSSRDDAVRWTSDVAGPETSEMARKRVACDVIQNLTGVEVERHHLEQETDALRFGAWIGGRHSSAGDRYKLYLERPRLAAGEMRRLRDLEYCVSRAIEWRMLGVDLMRNDREYYGRIGSLTQAEVDRILHWVGLSGAELIGKAASILRPRVSDNPYGRRTGLSVATRKGQPVAVTFFLHSRALARVDEGARLVPRAASLFGGQTAVLSALVGDAARPLGKIGIVGLGTDINGRCWIQAGWRPEAQPVAAESSKAMDFKGSVAVAA